MAPVSAGDTATFNTSTQTSLTLSGGVAINSITFNPGANAFTINTDGNALTLQGTGIVNNSGMAQTITDNGTVIKSATIKLTTRPDGAAETLLLNQKLAASFGITVTSDGMGGFLLSGTATLAQYQQVIASLQYTDSLALPNTQQRVIAVTVNDGISNSNTAFSRLNFLGGAVTTVNKQLYLSDPGQGMDRIDPVATGDTTTSSVAVTPVVSPNSTGLATWSNSATKNLVYRPWLLTGYGTPATATVWD